jgi:hypothetical protein
MLVQDFVQSLTHLSDLIDYTPVPNPTNSSKFLDAELAQIMKNACPAEWKKAKVQANLQHLSLATQTRYYTGLKIVEFSSQPTFQNPSCDTKISSSHKNENSKLKNDKKQNQRLTT